jgi:hypothetical protein
MSCSEFFFQGLRAGLSVQTISHFWLSLAAAEASLENEKSYSGAMCFPLCFVKY